LKEKLFFLRYTVTILRTDTIEIYLLKSVPEINTR
jgi:hypothetical protein